jgi:DNA repair protein RecO (recombination protein O)
VKIQTPGLIIKETNIGENDKLLVILTKDHGIIRAFADGVRRMKSKNNAATSLLCYANFTLYQNKDTYKVGDSSPIELFFDLRYHLEELSLAQYFCEMAIKLTPEEFEPTEILRLLLNSLHFLTNQNKPINIVKSVTELKLISLTGFMPNLTGCATCGEDDAFKFSYSEGCLFCLECIPESNDITVLNPTVLAAMRHIIYSDFGKIYSFEIPERDAEILSSVTEKYVSIQSEYKFKTLDFYKSVKEPNI